MGGALALAVVLVAPATAATQIHKKHPAPRAAELADDMIGSFTPAAGDPKLSGSFGRLGASSDGFRFTPSATPGSRRAVTVAVRARSTTKFDAERMPAIAAAAPTLGVAPSAYSLGAAIGWKRFAVTGDLNHFDAGLMPGSRDSADVALSYGGHSWSTRLALAGERTIDTNRMIGSEQSVALDLAGSYALAHNLDVTGGVRYKIQRDQLDIVDDRRDSQSVYIGTAFRF
ncbi:MAG: hypothetical protein JOY99_09165 [Sphingomonadaceae bacterium]|nr:hypothetical protein [Sphingomonadaceae bacterium]